MELELELELDLSLTLLVVSPIIQRLCEVIGTGGYGSVHKALDLTTGSLVATKQIFVGNSLQEDTDAFEVRSEPANESMNQSIQ